MDNASHVWYFAVISGDARCKALMQPYVEAATSLGESCLWLIRMACCSHLHTRFSREFFIPFLPGICKLMANWWRLTLQNRRLQPAGILMRLMGDSQRESTENPAVPTLKKVFPWFVTLASRKKNWFLPVGGESIILCLPVQMFYYPRLVGAEAIIKQAISEFPRASVSKRG